MCRLADGSEHNPLDPLPQGQPIVCCTLESHIILRSPQGDGRVRGWYAAREFARRAGLVQPKMPLWRWESALGRTVDDVIALVERVAANPLPDLEFGVFHRAPSNGSDAVSDFAIGPVTGSVRTPLDFPDLTRLEP